MGDMSSYFHRLESDQPPMESHTITNSPGDCYSTEYGDSTCHGCGIWVPSGTLHSCSGYHYCPTVWTWPYPPENKTEKAFRLLKKLVEMKVVSEPNSYKKFCDLIEKIAGVL